MITLGQNFIGIDQSYRKTAITTMVNPKEYKTKLFSSKGKDRLEKLSSLHDQLSTFFHNNVFSIDYTYAYIEGGSYASTGLLFSLGQLSGLILSMLLRKGVFIKEVPPSSLKKFITGYGHASKKFVMQAIEKKYNIKFTDDNIADSYVLALMGYYEKTFGSIEIGFRSELEYLFNEKKSQKVKKIIKKVAKKTKYRRKKLEF